MKKYHSDNSRHWQKDLVLLAKNTHVWFHQLSRKYSREIYFLEQIPAEELEEIRSLGFTGLWLIGIWERSPASLRIKQLYGRDHLIASAYSINGYHVANQLGGEASLLALKEKALQRGIYIACDMIPNHTGVDAPWVLDHPDWYIFTKKIPAETWEYNSEDLSPKTGIQIRIEDGYYTQQEAAEVFQYTTSAGDQPLFIYHGNDGTSMPWNDTAQLDYLKPQVRQAVKEQIVEVARRFPIIRLDAAMTLIREHFKRLWFPGPHGDSYIPTRDAFPMSQEEFDACMPREFWAEIMEALNNNAPDTLMLAEAFWLMEKYFIRDLGMHRVYNSAFLNQLRDENNAQLRVYFKEILASDPTLLEHFVNYLTTPDEAPAADAFGRGDKYFGVCGFMAALPGLPMFGHGQMEGLSEWYGMDFGRPMLDEFPDGNFLDEHQRLITPLLNQRSRFIRADRMVMFDFYKSDSTLDENVFAFSMISDDVKSLIVFNNANQGTKGEINKAANSQSMTSPSSSLTLSESLDLDGEGFISFREIRTGESRTTSVSDIKTFGLKLDLAPYQLLVFDIS